MRSGQHLKLPKSEQQAFEENLRLQAEMERLKIDIKVKDNGDGTVDIAWTVSEGTRTSDFDHPDWRYRGRGRRNCRGPNRRASAYGTDQRL